MTACAGSTARPGAPGTEAGPASRSWNKSAIVCPDTTVGETALDCPWAGIARELSGVAQRGESVSDAFTDLAPQIKAQLLSDSSLGSWLALWGRSINFDELAHGTVVDPAILDLILGLAQVSPRQDRIAHAGIEHTYGYLFSVLKTPYGYKRARWVNDDIETGFGLPRGTLGATPAAGTLFSNLSYFAGRIALKEDALAQSALALTTVTLADEIRHFDYSGLEVRRLIETVQAPRRIELHTDIVKFKNIDPARSNQALLIYSIVDSADASAKLITAFPVAAGFATGVFSNLGENLPVITRYNAYVEGLTASTPPIQGSRLEVPHPAAL